MMSLPTNYKQIVVGGPNVPSTPNANSGSSRSRSSVGGGGSDRNKDTTPIFTHSNYSNPAFTPQKVGKSSNNRNQANDSRMPKPPKPPEKPVLPYMRYSKRIWDSVKAQYPDLKLWELGKKIGALWKQLGESEKQEFIDEYEADKIEYEKALKAYHNSPAYQSYMAAKSKVKTDIETHETPSRASGKSQQERRIDIQPAEDEDDQDDGYSYKHLAYARYLRNHRLINEIFSDVVVPDVRSVVTTQRMQVLKRQVSSLTMHQTKLEAELQQMEEKFEAKKQRMMESSEAFQEELKRHCRPAVDEETVQKMAQRMYEEMKRDRQRLEDPANGTNFTGANNAIPPSAARGQIDEKLSAKKDRITTTTSVTKPFADIASSGKVEGEPMQIELSVQAKNSAKLHSEGAGGKTAKLSGSSTELGKDIKAGKTVQLGTAPSPGPAPSATPPPNSSTEHAAPQTTTTLPPTMHSHHGPPPPPTHHMPAHMAGPHPPAMPGMPSHAPYGNYVAPPTGSPRSPYYQPQYGPTAAHPSQPYGQYAPYSHYQQSPYGPPAPPPGTHYMNAARPPQHNGAYGESVPSHVPPHDIYGQGPPPPPPHTQVLPPTTAPPQPQATQANVTSATAPSNANAPTNIGATESKSDTDEKEK